MSAFAERLATSRGRFYEIEGQRYPSVTNILQVIGKPALLNWYAKTEREMVIEAASQLWQDAPVKPKMSVPAFVASLQKRLGQVKAAKKLTDAACDIGSQAHAMIEWTLHKEMGHMRPAPPAMSDEATWAFMAWEDWRKSVNLTPLFIEHTVYSKKHGYAGTIDLTAVLDLKDDEHDYGRTVCVIDWKTGKAIYEEAYLQNVAYAWAYHEMGHAEAPPPGLIVRLPKVATDPQFESRIIHSSKRDEHMSAFLATKKLWEWKEAGYATWKAKQDK